MNTSALMGNILAAQPGNVKLHGAGRRALDAQVMSPHNPRVAQLAGGWTTETGTRQQWTLRQHIRASHRTVPCNHGAVDGAHCAFGFPDEVTGTPTAERFTSTHIYEALYRELLATMLLGRASKQVQRCSWPCSVRWNRLSRISAPLLRVLICAAGLDHSEVQ